MSYRPQNYSRGNELNSVVNLPADDSKIKEKKSRDYFGMFSKGLILGGLAAICFGLGTDSESVVEYGAYGMIAGAVMRTYQTATRER